MSQVCLPGWPCSLSTLYLVAFPTGMMLVFVLPKHDDTGQGPQAGVQLGRQAFSGLEEGQRNVVSTFIREGRPWFKPSPLRRGALSPLL